MMDLSWLRDKIHNILKHPDNEELRVVSQESITLDWIGVVFSLYLLNHRGRGREGRGAREQNFLTQDTINTGHNCSMYPNVMQA